MPVFIDQKGRNIILDRIPQRIVSLVPSQTELLYDLGLRDEVVGITKFCVHPHEWFVSKTKVGGTRQLKMDVIHNLQPDLIIANKEENIKEQVEDLSKHYPVWTSNVTDLDSAYEMIKEIGSLTGKQKQSDALVTRITTNFQSLQTSNFKLRTAYLIWRNPYMTVGGDTFIHSLLEIAGFENVFADKTRYPEITANDLLASNCELLFLSTEPFPFKQKHIDELQPLLPGIKIILVDGEVFSWYGSRLIYAADYFKKLKKTVTAQ